jgi:S-adenosylmethionine synthetase
MTKIERIDAEILKAREKIAEFQVKIRTLEGQKIDEENALIVQMVRKQHMSLAELERFLDRHKNTLTNPTKTPPITAAQISSASLSTKKESEEKSQ